MDAFARIAVDRPRLLLATFVGAAAVLSAVLPLLALSGSWQLNFNILATDSQIANDFVADLPKRLAAAIRETEASLPADPLCPLKVFTLRVCRLSRFSTPRLS